MSKSALIIGGGIIGMCTAYYTARRGFRVTVLDRQSRDGDHCVLGSAGMICPSHFIPLAAPGMIKLGLKWMWYPESPFRIKPRLDLNLLTWAWFFYRSANRDSVARAAPLLRDLHLASRALFVELAALPRGGQRRAQTLSHVRQSLGDGDFGFTRRGLLMLCKTTHALEEEARTAEMARSLGVPAQVLDSAQTAALDPRITMDVEGSVYFPEDCHLDPARFALFMKTQAADQGVEFIPNVEVLAGRVSAGRLEAVQSSAGDFSADEVVLCGGAWSPAFAKSAGIRLPMQAGKGYRLTLSHPRQLPDLCSILAEARVAVTPLPGGRLRFGGTMEMAGMNESIRPRRVRGIVKSVPKYFPAFREGDFEGVEPWCGLRPCSPDGLPYLGRFRDFRNFSCATGHGMLGLSLGPITAQLMADVLAGESARLDISALKPDRFS
ncbi:MAG: NAD(P)/FAD-dependent oxidoreductase [Verrucomicrobiales bacterium]